MNNKMNSIVSDSNCAQANDSNSEPPLVEVSDRNVCELMGQVDSLASDYESIPNIENKDCNYLKLVSGFKASLVLPDDFFSYDNPVCYCAFCVSSSRSYLLKGMSFVPSLSDFFYCETF